LLLPQELSGGDRRLTVERRLNISQELMKRKRGKKQNK
jgi:hypothetical protein